MSCQEQKSNEIYNFLSSRNSDSIMRGVAKLNATDTFGVQYVLNTIYNDRKISHRAELYGQNVYQVKMEALKRISKLDPPNPINSTFDTINVEFYKNWAIQSGYLRNQ